jgi:hypothetical protein
MGDGIPDRGAGDLGQVVDQAQDRLVVGTRDRVGIRRMVGAELRGRLRAAPAAAAHRRDAHVFAGRSGAGIEAGEEALEVTVAVAAIAARVDPVVAQPTRVAPRTNGVRVDAEDLRRPSDAERRVERPRVMQIHLRHRCPRQDS